jgi:HSP90 family molecular chaperone
MSTKPPVVPSPSIENIGKQRSTISVEISARFLEHFSEQLYSSPQKAFEELISNGWDAGANRVDVRISQDLKNDATATMAVLDNGVSMDEDGLRQLWHIAFSPKRGKTTEHGRPIIGKFGIGKLATYVLANKLTYICKAGDGKIRRVTMDYGEIDRQISHHPGGEKLIHDMELNVFEVTEKEVV